MSTLTFKADRPGETEKTFREIGDIEPITNQAIRQMWFGLGRALVKNANREILRKPKGGRTYIIRSASGRRRRHVASAPGETHANMTGSLRKSLGFKIHGSDRMDFGYGVTGRETPLYAKWVEFGTTRMARRPSLENAITATQRDAETYFTRAMENKLGK